MPNKSLCSPLNCPHGANWSKENKQVVGTSAQEPL